MMFWSLVYTNSCSTNVHAHDISAFMYTNEGLYGCSCIDEFVNCVHDDSCTSGSGRCKDEPLSDDLLDDWSGDLDLDDGDTCGSEKKPLIPVSRKRGRALAGMLYGSADYGKKVRDDATTEETSAAGNAIRGPPLDTVSVLVDRTALDINTITLRYRQDEKPSGEPLKCDQGRLWQQKAKRCLQDTLPIVDWLGNYKWREDLISDMTSGLTVAVMHIPQGLAYALLGNVPPVVGIYMAFIPVLIYTLLGTSRTISIGTFAVICLMTGKVVTKNVVHFTGNTTNVSVITATASSFGRDSDPTPIEVATAVTIVVGIYQLVMWLFRLGILSVLLSPALVSGFTTGAAIHVLSSQMKSLLGVQIPRRDIPFAKSLVVFYDVLANIGTANVAAIVVSIVTIVLLCINNAVKPRLDKRCKTPIPVPAELIVVIAGTLLAQGPLKPYGLVPIGDIPTGIPPPVVPNHNLMLDVAIDALPIAIVAYTISMSMALIFAAKTKTEVRANQELLALGASNVVGSFFSCMPVTASLSRSAVQLSAGGRTQLTSFVSCSLLVIVLLWAGPLFSPLPRCVLAAIILVALRGMLMKITEVVSFYKASRWDGGVWLLTFLTVVVIEIDIGLYVGITASVLTLLVYAARPNCSSLAPLPTPDASGIYVDPTKFGGTVRTPGVALVRYSGVINFATRAAFRNSVYECVSFNPEKSSVIKKGALAGSTTNFVEDLRREETPDLQALVIDMSGVVRIDPDGAAGIYALVAAFEKARILVALAGLNDQAVDTLNFHAKTESERLRVFPVMLDAVAWAQAVRAQAVQTDPVSAFSSNQM